MAQCAIMYDKQGAKEKCLTLAGKEYICRTDPFADGIARGLDKPIDEQVEADCPDEEYMLQRIYEMVDGADRAAGTVRDGAAACQRGSGEGG